jgi:predicted DNA-binding transcriptional regulator YafY
MTTNQKRVAIRAQIRAKKAIAFTYQNETKERVGNPHTLGTSQDKLAIRIYQTSKTPSQSGIKGNGSPEDFRFFYLDDIDDIQELSEKFEVHPAFKSGDEAFEKIDVEVNND